MEKLGSEINSYTTKQKIILTIYAIVSLPLLPLIIPMYPFTKWVMRDANKKGDLELSLLELLVLGMSTSLFMYLFLGLAMCCPR